MHAIHTATLYFYTVTMVNFIDLLSRGYVHGYGPMQSSTVNNRAAAQGWEGSAFNLLYCARGIPGSFHSQVIHRAQTFALETQTLVTLQVPPHFFWGPLILSYGWNQPKLEDRLVINVRAEQQSLVEPIAMKLLRNRPRKARETAHLTPCLPLQWLPGPAHSLTVAVLALDTTTCLQRVTGSVVPPSDSLQDI